MPKQTRKRNQTPVLSGFEPYLYVSGDKFVGLNLDSDHINNKPGEFRELNNRDIYDNYIKTRRGFNYLHLNYNYQGTILNGVTWKIGTTEYFVYCQNAYITGEDAYFTRFFYKDITANSSFLPVIIKGTVSDYLSLTSATIPPSMKLSNNKIFVGAGTTDGNFIIEWNATDSVFEIRSLGLPKPSIDSVALSAGSMTGTFVLGLEIVTQVDGVDVVASSPNRINSSGILTTVIANTNKISVTVDNTTLPTGGGISDTWTHARLYCSQRIGQDLSDPLNQIVYPGQETILYQAVVISREDLATASYIIDLDIPYDQIGIGAEAWEINRIELDILPAGDLIAFHLNHIYISGCATIDPTLSNLYFSQFVGTQYDESWNAFEGVIHVSTGDGQRTTEMISLDNNLIIFKESSTYVLQNGITSVTPPKVDNSIGISHFKFCAYIPKLGIVAITSDDFNLKIFNRNLQWTNLYNKLEISRQIKSKIRDYAANPYQISFIYINEKLMICNGGGAAFNYITEFLVLHVGQNRGWSTYTYPINSSRAVFTFENGSRAAIVSDLNPLYEIEVFGKYDDGQPGINVIEIETSEQTWMFQNNKGLDLLDLHRIQVSATLNTDTLKGTIVVNEVEWESQVDVDFTPNPSELLPDERSEVYELTFDSRPANNFMYLNLKTTGNTTINFIRWVGFIMPEMALNYTLPAKYPELPVILVQPEDVEV